MNGLNKKKAQQLVEFLLVAPILIIILGILTEYAYALNINLTLAKAIKTVGASVYSEIKPSMTQNDIETLIKGYLIDYLDDNSVPTNAENNISLSYVTRGSSAIFMTRYTYYPAFTLPNVWFKFMPDQFDFFATAAVPKALVSSSDYSGAVDSRALDKVWSLTASFSSQDEFIDSKKGIMKSVSGRNEIMFLVPTAATDVTDAYALTNWDSSLKIDPVSGNPFVVDMNDGKFYTCTAVACNPYAQAFYPYITSNNYYNLFFVTKADASFEWLNPAGAVDISDTSVVGFLKNLLSMTKNNFSLGNYDNLKVSGYNPSVSPVSTYETESFGSFIITYPSEVTQISNLGITDKSRNYNFGSKVN